MLLLSVKKKKRFQIPYYIKITYYIIITIGGQGCGSVDRSGSSYMETQVLSTVPHKMGMIVHTCNLSTRKVEIGGSRVQGHP